MKRARLSEGRAEEGVARLQGDSVDLVIADPPYDIAVGGVDWVTTWGLRRRGFRNASASYAPEGLCSYTALPVAPGLRE